MHYETMWKFRTAHLTVEWAIAPDQDVETDWDETGETDEKLASGEWQAFVSRIRVLHRPTGAELGVDYLGGSIYANPREFRDHIGNRGRYGSYFRDMVGNACAEARQSLHQLQALPLRT